MILIALAMLPVLGLVLYHAATEREARLRALEDEGWRIAEMAAAGVGQVIESSHQLLLAMACAESVHALNVPAATAYFTEVLRHSAPYLSIGLAGPDGRLLASAVPVGVPVDYSDRLWFQTAQQTRSFTVGEYIVSRSTGQPSLTLALPLPGQPLNRPVPVLYAAMDLTALQDCIACPQLPPQAVILVLEMNGIMLVHYPREEAAVGQVFPPWRAARAAARAARPAPVDAVGPHGVARRFFFLPAPGTRGNLLVGVGLSQAVVLAESRAAALHSLAGLGLITLLALLGAWFMAARWVLRPVRHLAAAARQLAGGDWGVRVRLRHGSGEFQDLAATFDEMAVHLQVHRDRLEDLVRERTAELHRVNAQLRAEVEEHQRTAAARTAATQQLRASQQQLQAILDNTPALVSLKDREGRFILVNRQFEAAMGVARDRLLGRTSHEVFPRHLADMRRRNDLRVMAEQVPFAAEEANDQPDGRHVYLAVKFPLFDASHTLYAVGSIAHDITERKRAEERLEQAKADLERSNVDLEQFAYVASHDLQEPLRMVTSYVQLLAKRYAGRLDADADDFIAFAVDGAKRMQALINDLLTYSRVSARGKPLAPTDCDRVLQETLHNLQLAITERGADITPARLPVVWGDPVQLSQLFQNLLSNAIKFSAREVTPRIQIGAERHDAEWVIAVRDNGIGMDLRHAGRIFQIFQRLHTRDEYPGTGIGLAVCKKIVERHGGRIWVDSEAGKGSTFFFTLRAVEDGAPQAHHLP